MPEMQEPQQLSQIEQIEDDMGFFDDWEDRYRYVIDLGKALQPMAETDKTDANIVHGCTSQVWLTAETTADASGAEQIVFHMDSDALIVRGLLALVRAAYSGRPAAAIAEYDIESLFERLDLLSHLSMTRGNGLRAMVARIQQLAGDL